MFVLEKKAKNSMLFFHAWTAVKAPSVQFPLPKGGKMLCHGKNGHLDKHSASLVQRLDILVVLKVKVTS